MPLTNPQTSVGRAPVQLGFKTSIIALFVAIVLVIGLTLVYLSFERITAITNSAASQFIGKVAEILGRPDQFAITAGAGQFRNIECVAADPVGGNR